jgi:hypothetical protein
LLLAPEPGKTYFVGDSLFFFLAFGWCVAGACGTSGRRSFSFGFRA